MLSDPDNGEDDEQFEEKNVDSTCKDDENMHPEKLQKILSSKKPVRRNVASKLYLNGKVTPRSIAYVAVQVCLFLLYDILQVCSSITASSTLTCKLRVVSTTMDYTIILSMFLKIHLGLR